MDSKVEHTHQEEVYNTPQKGGRKQNCCRRFWWAICLVLIVILLVVLLPIIYVAIPNKAQHDINASTLEVTHQDTVNPTSDTIDLKLDSTIRSSSPFHPTIDSFPAALSLKGKSPFLTVQVPEAKSSKVTNITIQQNSLKITDMNAFTDYVTTVLTSETFDVYMNGKATLHLSGLPSMKVNYNKIVTMKGLNKLSSLNVTDIKIVPSMDPTAPNLLANATIFNPSVMTLDLGNITMNMSVDGQSIGTSLMPNVKLYPGPNTLPLQANSNQTAVIALVLSTNAKYKNGVLPVDIVGDSCVHNGQHLSYYEAALKSNPMRLNLNIAPALGLNVTSS